jgi:hypothetical protein
MARAASKTKSGDDSGVGELRTGPIAGTAIISGVTFGRKAVQYAEIDGVAVFEGDIVLGSIEEFEQQTARLAGGEGGPVLASIGITGAQFRWPNGVIPFEIDPNMPNQQRVTGAIAHWEANTALRFPQRSSGTFSDWIRFEGGSGCSSQVGRRGGQQVITLGSGCTTGNAIHEIGHSVGLWHEQSREDRDTFIRIVWENVDPAFQHNFLQHITDGDDLGPYDYGSIMHYPPTAFSINGQDTIVPLQPLGPGVVMGQRDGLSPGDIAGVLAMYPNVAPTFKEPVKDPIQDTIKEINKDPIRDTLKEPAKDPIQDTLKEGIRDTIKELNKDPIQDTLKEANKDPIQDTLKEGVRDTLKEAGKDPIQDTLKEGIRDTLKEAGYDPGTLVEHRELPPINPQFRGQTAMPFVMATPSRVGAFDQMADVVAAAASDVQALAEALVAAEEQLNELSAMYEAAVQQLDALQQGQ